MSRYGKEAKKRNERSIFFDENGDEMTLKDMDPLEEVTRLITRNQRARHTSNLVDDYVLQASAN